MNNYCEQCVFASGWHADFCPVQIRNREQWNQAVQDEQLRRIRRGNYDPVEDQFL